MIINTLLCIGAIVFTATMMYGWGVFVKIVCYIIPSVCLITAVVTLLLKKYILYKTCFVVSVCAFIIVCAISIISKTAQLDKYPTDSQKIERLTEIIRNTGKCGMIVFVLIQILQVVILPLPAVVCYVPGSRIWGAGIATLLASAGVLIGSLTAYFIGRFFGKRAVEWIAGKETTEKYINYIGNKGKIIFVFNADSSVFSRRHSLYDSRTYRNEFPVLFSCNGYYKTYDYCGVLLLGQRQCNTFQRLGNTRLDSDIYSMYRACAFVFKISGQSGKMARCKIQEEKY